MQPWNCTQIIYRLGCGCCAYSLIDAVYIPVSVIEKPFIQCHEFPCNARTLVTQRILLAREFGDHFLDNLVFLLQRLHVALQVHHGLAQEQCEEQPPKI